MTDDKRPLGPIDAASKPEDLPVSVPEEVEPDLFSDDEHDGWSEIKRRPSDPGTR